MLKQGGNMRRGLVSTGIVGEISIWGFEGASNHSLSLVGEITTVPEARWQKRASACCETTEQPPTPFLWEDFKNIHSCFVLVFLADL